MLDFQASNSKINFVLIFFDAFSLYVDCTTLENKKAITVARQIELFVAKYGLYGQSRITSDLGTEFENELLKYELERLNIPKLCISGHNPQSNRCERSHLEIKKILRTLLHNLYSDLNYKIHMAVYKYNHLGSKYLDGKSPFNVIYGFEPDYLSAWIYIKSFEESDDSYNRASYNVPDQVNNWMKLHSNLLTETV